ncbi:hypothetical protein PPACK8108_LOCUS7470 [Phakopsora pachyrhizi]|uniref:Uncharacterized protein n=1 Tax=Phakopsora pachyrhizi TaxID=170000 RepID=A0AAV0AWA7_PHAPC|nr:hypothetical protein PPACK8108_LOCUS7470 [Phakopsora pachyrhizi]
MSTDDAFCLSLGDSFALAEASWRPIGITSTRGKFKGISLEAEQERQEDNFWLMRLKVGDHPARKPVGVGAMVLVDGKTRFEIADGSRPED